MKVFKSLKFWSIISLCVLGILAICLFMLPDGDSKGVSIGATESQSDETKVESENISEEVYDDSLASGISSMVDGLISGASAVGEVANEVVDETTSNIDDTPATNETVVEETQPEVDVVMTEPEAEVEVNLSEGVSETSVTSVSNVVFYGDSWMDNPVFRSRFGANNILRVKGAKWAQYFVQTGLVSSESSAKAVFVQFGLNDWQTGETGLTNSSYMKKFLDQLGEAHPGIPLIITRSPHTGSGYVSMTGCNINPRCDRYSQYVKEYCDTHENYYYVDATSCLEDSNGWLKSGYVDSSTYHLTNKGYEVWFNQIDSVILDILNK